MLLKAAHLHSLVKRVSHQLHSPEANALLHIAAFRAARNSASTAAAAVCASVVATSCSLAAVCTLANLHNNRKGTAAVCGTDTVQPFVGETQAVQLQWFDRWQITWAPSYDIMENSTHNNKMTLCY
jgi:hypothetical protein